MEKYLIINPVDGAPLGGEVAAIDAPMYHHKMGYTYTASGYGAAMPLRLKVPFRGRLYRVYCTLWSNVGTCWIKSRGIKYIVR
jgi:hypothetical protein